VVLLRTGGLPKTSSGKVQRARCRGGLGEAGLPILHEWRMTGAATAPIDFTTESLSQPSVLERQLVNWLQIELAVTDLTWRTPLTELGIDSLKGVELVNSLSVAFDHTFPATSMLDHPTVASLADLIRGSKSIGNAMRGPAKSNIYTIEEIHELDEHQLTELLRRRVDDVLDGTRL